MDISKEDGQTIWMIDDDKIQHFCFERSLQIRGLSGHMMSFFNGQEAMNFFSEHLEDFSLLPDVIFLDLNMPYVDGWQFLEQYAQMKNGVKKQTKIFVLSSSINNAEINRATSIPEVSGYFSKPLKPNDILEALEAC